MRRLCLLAALVFLSGCCGRHVDLPPTARVNGTVTLDGSPVAGAQVQFIPDASQGTTGAPAMGFTDDTGKFDLVTATVKGAIVGHHRVRVEARAAPKDEMDTLPALLTPAIYADETKTPLTAEVVAGKTNQIDLQLTSQGERR
ncbi:MAG: carboxypeptidase regulatory-like domain-containing protein [Planctomycetales bacterium]|nr:carboxypeptidase regulatory-like domain-containing protein [Planctomycetales bacterium]